MSRDCWPGLDMQWVLRRSREIGRRLAWQPWESPEDVAQEAVLRLLQVWDRLPVDPGRAERYAYRVMEYAARRRVRQWYIRNPVAEPFREYEVYAPEPDERAWTAEDWERALRSLTELERRAVLAMAKGGDKRPHGNAAKAMGLAKSTAHGVLHRAFDKLRPVLASEGS